VGKVYLISCGSDFKRYKIGFTKRNIETRIKELRTGNSEDFKIVAIYESEFSKKIETILHRKYKMKKISGEWFNLTEDEVKCFQSECEELQKNLKFLIENNTWIPSVKNSF